MTLRRHQTDTAHLADEIAAGREIRQVLVSVTPGGGKSALPGILADRLIPGIADRILWVVPRNTLREQGEGDFPEWSRYRIRAAGNEANPCRGVEGYVTTYQAIVSDPARHLDTLSRGRWILFLDEPHHCLSGGAWDQALSPLASRAVIAVYASGTFARGDGQRIAGIEYSGGEVVLRDTDIRYSRSDALREGAIVPVHFRHLDGRAEWEDEQGEIRSVDSLVGQDYAGPALFTALRTGYALELLDEAVTHWLSYRASTYAQGKLLVVAPDIKTATLYLAHLVSRRIDSLIATSDDSPSAAECIARFKGHALPTADCLVTVGMAYEGLSVPAVSHIACLTHIRSIPWLEQCFARGNRIAPGKSEAFVFGPLDDKFRSAIEAIEAEQAQALKDSPWGQGGASGGDSEGEGSGPARPKIIPLESSAYRASGATLFDAPLPDGGLTPSAAQALLRREIDRHIKQVLAETRAGNTQAKGKVIHGILRVIAGGKRREDCTVEELTAQWAYLKERWPL